VSLLLEGGADPLRANNYGRTPVSWVLKFFLKPCTSRALSKRQLNEARNIFYSIKLFLCEIMYT
jgi:hypothetical protein